MHIQATKNAIQEDNDQMLSIGEVSRLLGVAPITLRRWDISGILPAVRLYHASRRYYRKFDVFVFIKKKSALADAVHVTEKVSEPVTIRLADFGTKLSKAEDGKRAWQSFQPQLEKMPLDAQIEIDFSDVVDFYPEWAREFLVPLHEIYGDSITMINIEQYYFLTTLEITDLYRDPYRSY